MNAVAAEIFARGYVTGFFDVVSALTGGEATASPETPISLEQLESSGAAADCELVLHSPIAEGGAVVVMLPGDGAAAVFGAATGEEAATWETVQQADAASLREVFEPCMGGGVSHFKEKYGQVLTIDNVDVSTDAGKAAKAALEAAVGADGIAAAFALSVGPIAGTRGVVAFSKRFEDVIPADVVASAGSDTGGAGVGESLSQDDISGILSDNAGGQEFEPTGPDRTTAPASQEQVAKNLDMVRDIRLVATARLGRVEMPIAEILALGPGSIIEVGHLVDEPVELLINDKLIARGDVVVVDEKFGLRITEIVSPRERIESLR